jgi:CBS domain containing-hemolysin-like protein
MTPRTEVDYLVLGQPIGEMLKTIQRSAYTRYPLCEGDLDHVVGLVHMKDLFVHLKLVPGKLRFADEKTPDGQAIAIADGKPGSMVHVIGTGEIDLNEVRRDILFVPALLPVPRLLRQFQTSHIHMGVVVDPDSGATLGIVTLEDVIEELVGEIDDEFDASKNVDFVKDGENFRVAGHFPIRELRDKLELANIEPQGDVDTLGGYITQVLGRFPRAGDTIDLGDYTARVLGVQQRRVTQVMISPKTQEAMRADGPGEV